MQVSLAVVAAVCGAGTWMLGETILWLAGALLILGVIPFTFLFVMNTNNRLLDSDGRDGDARTGDLLKRWGRLHAVRSGMGLAAGALYLWSAVAK